MLITEDVIRWAKDYKGPKFHALLCDPPYHLVSITKRFGGENAAPAKPGNDGSFARLSRGFMGEQWDGSGIAFDKDTWALLGEHLYDGAFGFAFASPRTYHRLAVAIEDAGFIIHPAIGWVQSQGFTKATNLSKSLDRRAGAERPVVSKYSPPGSSKEWNLKQNDDEDTNATPGAFTASGRRTLDITESVTDEAKTWDGHFYGAQALKPTLELICVFQKPYDGDAVDSIVATGAGTYNIDLARVAVDPDGDDPRLGGRGSWTADTEREIYGDGWSGTSGQRITSSPLGRWPANFVLCHTPECHVTGYHENTYTINRFDDGAKVFGGGAGHEYTGEKITVKLPVWECHESCPVPLVDAQTGILKSGLMKSGTIRKSEFGYHGWKKNNLISNDTYGDAGGGSRFFFQAHWFYEIHENLIDADPIYYQPKASTNEREHGLKHLEPTRNDYRPNDPGENTVRTRPRRNLHPTVKPIALNEYLAKLLLPPTAYAPRRILVPFAGVASEVIGAWLAGWEEIVGIEISEKYSSIGKLRLDYWKSQGKQLPLF